MLDLGLAVMRGERERPRVHMAYWLLVALYAFAMLGNAVAAVFAACTPFSSQSGVVSSSSSSDDDIRG